MFCVDCINILTLFIYNTFIDHNEENKTSEFVKYNILEIKPHFLYYACMDLILPNLQYIFVFM